MVGSGNYELLILYLRYTKTGGVTVSVIICRKLLFIDYVVIIIHYFRKKHSGVQSADCRNEIKVGCVELFWLEVW